MSSQKRPVVSMANDPAPAEAFVQTLQQAIERSDADLFDSQFAADVLWGSPFGAVVEGYDTINSIHRQMFARAPAAVGGGTASRYTIEHAKLVAQDVAVAFVRRLRGESGGQPEPGRADAFDELALYVLVRREETWWLAAGQNVPDRRDVYTRT